MSTAPTLPLSDIVNVIVLVTPQAPAAPSYNQGLLVGPSTVIPAAQRVRKYTSINQMLTDGFNLSSPEVIAAALYFSQLVPAQSVLIGRQDLTSIQTWNLHSGAIGTGFVVGDLCGVIDGGASGAILKVTAINGSGAITAAQLIAPGTGYTVANNLALSGGTGTGGAIDITAIGDTYLYAVSQCRVASNSWYGVMCCNATTADHEAIAPIVQALKPASAYIFSTADAAVLNNQTGNVLAILFAQNLSRTLGIYSTAQNGAFPNNLYSAAAVLGLAMGLNTGLVNSAYTLFGKTIVGVAPEPLTETQFENITAIGGNLYLNFGGNYQAGTFVGGYTIMTGGTMMAASTYFDQIINRDMLSSNIQFNVMNRLTELPKVAQTDPQQTVFIDAVNAAAEVAVGIGYIGSGGEWNGPTVLKLEDGDFIPSNGFVTQSPSYNTQSTSDRNARKAMPVYLSYIEAGAAQSITIGVYDQT